MDGLYSGSRCGQREKNVKRVARMSGGGELGMVETRSGTTYSLSVSNLDYVSVPNALLANRRRLTHALECAIFAQVRARMSSATSVIDFRTFDPRRNLPTAVGRKRGESNYAAAFARTFVNDRAGKGVGGRHFAVAGYGIADFLWVDMNWRADTPKLMAFEMKLKDWKKALGQAYRYSYFADHAVVVLPPESIGRAMASINVFKKMGIGLWSFDVTNKSIEPIHHPKSSKPRNGSAKEKAVALLWRRSKFRNLLELSDAVAKSG